MFRRTVPQSLGLLVFFAAAALCLIGAPFETSQSAFAQEAVVTVAGPDGQVIQMARPIQGMPGKPPGAPGKQPGEKDGKPDGEKGKEGDKPDGKEAAEPPEPKIIRRGDQQDDQADPDELKATVGPDGKVAFQFRNQPWVDLVQWLADIAKQPLDWQELPADRVNLRSPGRYTVSETKDLFNRHLLARGYTLLEMPGGITVAKTEGINPAMVPRVTLPQLESLMPHSFVRTSLELGWLSSEKMAEELKPMISSNGRLTPLTTTNRIEAMDAAINLKQIASLLEQERNQSSRDSLAPEFRLRHIPAETAKEMLEAFLGVEKKSNAPMSPQQMQMMQQMQQRNGGKPMPQPKKPEISIVANTRQNSVFIRAPVDRIAIATEFIKRIDVPGQGLASLADIESRIQVFRLTSIDPEKLIEIIGEMNVLEPATRVRADDNNRALIVSGSAADRYIIGRLIDRLDGSGRQFEVLQLRRLDATEVAESIAFLMGKDKEEEDNSSSRRYFSYYGYGGREEEKKDEDEFRVAANSRFRQVLLWANDSEMEQVRNLLIKLGELPPPGGSKRTIRRIDASSTPETYEYLLRLKQQWSQLSDAPLELPTANLFVDPILEGRESEEESDDEDQTEGLETEGLETEGLETNAGDPDATRESAIGLVDAPAVGQQLTAMPVQESAATQERLANDSDQSSDPGGNTDAEGATKGSGESSVETQSSIQSAADFDRFFGQNASRKGTGEAAEADPRRGSKSPIRIELDDDGNLLLLGADTKALDQLENLMLQVSPPKRPYHVFKIKHQTAGYIRLNLVEYFENSEEEDSDADRFYRWWFDEPDNSDEGPKGLGKNNELRFVYDPDTNTIVVSGATSSQLRTISELIELWDVAEPVNKRRMRYTKLVNVEFGRAETIAETVKEAYRDLLSSNDKTFAKNGRGGGGGGGGGSGGGEGKSSGRESRGSGLIDGDNGRDGGDVDFSFKGKLSMGVDTVGNTLLISAEGEPLLDLVVEMVHKLDLAAKPAGDMQVFSVSGNTSEDSIQNVLRAFGGRGTGRPGRPTPPPAVDRPAAQRAEEG